ncbi:hypothetical protein CRG98_027970 [Punica granatum]|uniref:Uncharacterized protein n=1 Tax=Punica granatum TaxID=22663 RepID=A0A2I0J608_PUNGR|nr:hypothetical protein CRG98_027970 [Punica granatum]
MAVLSIHPLDQVISNACHRSRGITLFEETLDVSDGIPCGLDHHVQLVVIIVTAEQPIGVLILPGIFAGIFARMRRRKAAFQHQQMGQGGFGVMDLNAQITG